MPTVLPLFRGLRVVIYPNDHRPPHCHVIGIEMHARFELLCDLGEIRLLSNIGFGLAQLKQIGTYLLSHVARLCSEWERFHGHH